MRTQIPDEGDGIQWPCGPGPWPWAENTQKWTKNNE